jgi:hypothetical protein
VLAYDPVAMEDRRFELKRRAGLVAAGIMTPNEARAEEGLPPMEDGDELRLPVGASGAASGISSDVEPSQPSDGDDTRE